MVQNGSSGQNRVLDTDQEQLLVLDLTLKSYEFSPYGPF
jgi:hypothetical protein